MSAVLNWEIKIANLGFGMVPIPVEVDAFYLYGELEEGAEAGAQATILHLLSTRIPQFWIPYRQAGAALRTKI